MSGDSMEPTLLDGDVVMVDRSNDLLMLRRSLKFLQKGSLKQANTTRFKALIACNPTGTVDIVKLFCVTSDIILKLAINLTVTLELILFLF